MLLDYGKVALKFRYPCMEIPEAGVEFTYPGTIYGFPKGSDPTIRTGYTVPLRENITDVLSTTSPICGLPSDPE